MPEKLTACISGSFKLKPEIDELQEEFMDHGVKVLEPSRGWLYLPGRMPENYESFRPLPSERGLTLRHVEDRFLKAISRSTFLYVNNFYGYIGMSTALEIGYAHNSQKPIFARQPLNVQNFEGDLIPYFYWREVVQVASPAKASQVARTH